MTVLAKLSCTIDVNGITRPEFADLLETMQAKFQSIYGADAYIDPDSQDGQMLAAVVAAIDDCNAATVDAYNAYGPNTAQGAALSSQVKINGLTRQLASRSSVDLTIVGTVGTIINGGIAQDAAGTRWVLPSPTVIPGGGTVTVTAMAEVDGAVTAAVNTVTIIATPTLGWQTVNNASAAAAGAAAETDAALRRRQAVSTALPSRTVLDGIKGAILNLTGVTATEVYENDTNSVDSNGLPAHSIAPVVIGGTDADIASTILVKKAPGVYTQGTTIVNTVFDPAGIGPYTIRFYRPTAKRVVAEVDVKALTGYTTAVGVKLKAALAAFVTGLGIGKKVDFGRCYMAAQMFGTDPDYLKYEVNAVRLGFFGGGGPTQADLAIAFNEIAGLAVADITLTVT